MAKEPKMHRGVSFGTILMLVITAAVVTGLVYMMPRLSGQTDLTASTQQVASLLAAELNLPELKLEDIPIFQQHASQAPTPQPSQAAFVSNATQAPGDTPVPTATPAITAQPAQTPAVHTFTLTAGGSVAVRTGVRQSAYVNKAYNFEEIFSYLKPALTANLCVATLHNTLSDSSNYSDVNAPSLTVQMLKNAGFDTLLLGTENVLDLGASGLSETVAAVKGAGFTQAGAYTSAQEKSNPLILTFNTVPVALLHYQSSISSTGKRSSTADEQAYAVSLLDVNTIAADIKNAKAQGARVIIVSLHWGTEDAAAPTADQKSLAQQIANAGADVIIGTHSNTVQTVEYLTGNRADGTKKPTLVAYSLGALLTDSREGINIAGVLLHLQLTYNEATDTLTFDTVEYTPTYIWRYQEDGQYRYRVVRSNAPAPEGMSDSQKEVMARALTRVQNALNGSAATLRNAQ